MAIAAIPVSDGFDFPAGWPDGTGYGNGNIPGDKDGWGFLENEGPAYGNVIHPGEDWNGVRGGDTDLGNPVYAVANGHVVSSDDYGCGWGNIVMIEHKENKSASSATVWSNYAHLETRLVSSGDYVRRGQQIGTVGKGTTSDEPCDKIYSAHLHFEIRRNYLSPSSWKPIVETEEQVLANYYNPSSFIDSHRPQPFPLVGDWDGNGIDETGTFNPRESRFILKNGKGEEALNHQMGEPGDLPIVGDWNSDGNDTIGVYRPKEAKFFLDNDNNGVIDATDQWFLFENIGDYPIVGDWNKDGKDEAGVFRSIDPTTLKTTFFLKDIAEPIEFGTQTDMPIAGDWNNDGKDDIGVFRKKDSEHENKATFYLKNPDKTISITYGENNDLPIAGRPQIDKLTRIGVYKPLTGEFIFKPEPITPIGSSKLDLIFLVDTTGSMGDDIDQVKLAASGIVGLLDLLGLDYRVAVADYRDYPQYPYGGSMDYVYKLDLPFSSDKNAIINSINGLSLGWGADWKESVYSAYYLAMTDVNKDGTRADNYGWRPGATKAIIVMGDAPPHDPEPWAGGHTLEEIIIKSLEIDPVMAYSIVVGSDPTAYSAFSELSEGTGGKVYTSPTANGVVDAIMEAIGDIGEPTTNYEVSVNITPASNEASPGRFASYSVNVTNEGNINDTYSISLDPKNFIGSYRGYPMAIQSSWIAFDNSQVELDPSASETRPLAINVPSNWAGMEDIIYSFNVTARSKTDEAISNTTSADLKVKANKRSMVEYSKLEIQWLSELIISSGTDQEIKDSLLDKLTNASLKLDQAIININGGKAKSANNMLIASGEIMSAFINQVGAQYDKKIMQPDAEMLEEKANRIIQDIEKAKNT